MTDQASPAQAARARVFHDLHVPGAPLVLYNIWDAATAQAVAETGAPALATGSWSVAAAQGYADGEALPLDTLLQIAGRIAAVTDLPLSIDFEGAYATAPEACAANVGRLIETGAVGLNFEDQIVGGTGLHDVDHQVARIRAIRAAADAVGLPLFINARTDLFLQAAPDAHAACVPEAIDRAAAYAEAGASGFFVPGLGDPGLIETICAAATRPVNVMMGSPDLSLAQVAGLGVARASYGPNPIRWAMDDLKARVAALT